MHKNYDAMVARGGSNAKAATELNGGLYSAFTVGSVRLSITDLRSNADRSKKQLLGDNQMSWFKQELQRAKKMDVVVWMSTRP